MNIKFKKLNVKAKIPSKGTKESACYDLFITKIIEYLPNMVEVRYGLSTEIPEGYKAVIVPRSSFSNKNWVMCNTPGQIDSDYRGEWISKFQALPNGFLDTNKQLNYSKFPYKEGERVTQFYIEKIQEFNIEEVTEINNTERGEGGFGSTNKN